MEQYILTKITVVGMSGAGTIICLVWRCPNKRALADGDRNTGHIFGNINARSTAPFNLTAPLGNTLQRSTIRRRKCSSGW